MATDYGLVVPNIKMVQSLSILEVILPYLLFVFNLFSTLPIHWISPYEKLTFYNICK